MGLQPLTIEDLKFPEGQLPELQIYDWGNAGKKYAVKVLTRNGMERQPFTSSSDRSVTARAFRLSNLPLMVSVEEGQAGVRRGEIYVQVYLRFAGVHNIALIAGYVNPHRNLSWPPGFFEDSVEGSGLLRSVTGTDPAAGAEINETVPTNARWRILGIMFRLVTNSTSATRRSTIMIDDGTTPSLNIPSPATQAASLTQDYIWQSNGWSSTVYSGIAICGIPVDLFLFQGWRIRTITASLQAGDNYGAPQLLVEEWIQE